MISLLYVDDESGLLEIGKLYLELSPDITVETRNSAMDALELLKIRRFDAVISDYQMPGMDGLEFLMEVRRRHAQIPFIIFTGKGREEIVIRALNSGADFYVQKGGDPGAQFTELIHKVRQAVQRRWAEAALEESEVRFRTLADAAMEGIMIHDRGVITDCNPRFAALFGYMPAEIIGRNGFEFLMPPESRDAIFRWKQEGSPGTLDGFGTRKDGSLFMAEISSAPILWRGKELTVVHMRDISDRKRAEEELRASYEQLTASEEELRAQYDMLARSERRTRESEEKYRALFENAGDPIFILDSRGNVDCNSRAEQVFGYTREQMIGKSLADLSPQQQPDGRLFADKAREKMTAAFSGEPQLFEWVHTRSDGTLFSAEVSLNRFRLKDEYCLLAIVRDVTERIRSDKALAQAKKKLNLLNNVTFDDIQSMIFTLSGYQQIAQNVVQEGPAVPILAKEGEILRKVSQSLKFARTYQDLGLKSPQWQDVSHVFLLAISHLDFLKMNHAEALDRLEIFADPMLEQVFQVLADNVLVHGKTATQVLLRYTRQPGSVTLFFEDDGAGIPADLKEGIFLPDFQNNKIAGLFLAREILEITGISIRETGEPGNGARFEITVPEGMFRFGAGT